MSERQHELTVIVPIARGKRGDLIQHLQTRIGYQQSLPANAAVHQNVADHNATLLSKIDGLHFISFFTFAMEDAAGDPKLSLSEPAWLVLEASFDGPAKAFARRFARGFTSELRAVFSHCVGFASGQDIFGFIWAHRRVPQCVYVGAPGLERHQIQQERRLRECLRDERDRMGSTPADHAHFIKAMDRLDKVFGGAKAAGLVDDEVPPIPTRVIAGKPALEILAVLIPLVLISLYILAIGPLPTWDELKSQPVYLIFLPPIVGVLAYALVSSGRGFLLSAVIMLGVLASAVGTAAISQIVMEDVSANVYMMSRFALAGIAVLGTVLVLGLYVLESRENESLLFGARKDFIDNEPMNLGHMHSVCEMENSEGCMQNHFVNLSIVKSGLLRLFALKAALRIVHVLGVLYFNRGKLGGIPSIHFARWIVLPQGEFGNHPLLLFMTNYDSSWDSYLGDFVDEASEGVSGIWSNTGGFPRTWFLVFLGGSRFEKQFKAYARRGQVRSSAWFSAYPNISVQEKLSNAALRRAFEQRHRKNAPVKIPGISAIAEQDDILRRL